MIFDEFFVRVQMIASALPFPCLIMEFCRLKKVPFISGVENKVGETKMQDMEKMKNIIKFELRVHKTQTLGPNLKLL